MTTKECTVCGTEKPINEYPKNGTFPDGTPRWRNDCKECYGITRNMKKHKVKKFVNNTLHRTGEVSSYSVNDWKDALIHFRGRCAYCDIRQSRRVKLTKEHLVPVDKGGKTVRVNIIPACTACNSSKSNRDFEDWYRKHPMYTPEREQRIKEWRDGGFRQR